MWAVGHMSLEMRETARGRSKLDFVKYRQHSKYREAKGPKSVPGNTREFMIWELRRACMGEPRTSQSHGKETSFLAHVLLGQREETASRRTEWWAVYH